MALVVVGQARVDDAHTAEGDPLLPARPVDLVGRAEPQRVVGASEHPALEETRDIVRAHRPVGDAALRRLDLDHRLQPQQATRAVAQDA